MSGYRILQDIEITKELLGLTKEEIAAALGVSRVTLHSWLAGKNRISEPSMAVFYDFAFKSGIRLNKIMNVSY